MALEDEFSKENIESYAEACINLAMDMPKYKFDTLLIPSRGAVPVFLGTLYALKYLGECGDTECKNFTDRLTAPYIIRKAVIPGKDKQPSKEGRIGVMPFPFTADLNLSKYQPTANNDTFKEFTRQYHSKVLRSFLKEPEERVEDPYFKLFTKLLSDVENRGDLAKSYALYPKIENLAMIDTAISGQAIYTILEALGQENIHPEAFVILDEDGKRLRSPYKERIGYDTFDKDSKFLYEKRGGHNVKIPLAIDRRKINFYPMKKIVTEDQGCALQGVAAAVYPSIITEGLQRLSEKVFPVGAGTWYPLTSEKKHRKIFYKFINTLKLGIKKNFCGNSDKNRLEDMFESKREGLIRTMKDTKLEDVDKENLKHYYPNYNMDTIENVYESSAKVVHICFNKDFTNFFLENVEKELGIKRKEPENKDI
ncbi:MAG: hypothetical protein V1886_00170 [archaeon]